MYKYYLTYDFKYIYKKKKKVMIVTNNVCKIYNSN